MAQKTLGLSGAAHVLQMAPGRGACIWYRLGTGCGVVQATCKRVSTAGLALLRVRDLKSRVLCLLFYFITALLRVYI